MKILRWLLPLLCASAFAQTPGFNYYVPANGVQVNTGLSAANTAATYQNIAGLWEDGSCTGVVAILLNGTCSTIGTGSVTGVSVVTANGLAGTVSNPTVNAAITLATTFTGIGYSNGTGFAAAVAGNFPTLNQSTSGNAATATAFAAAPSGCSGSTFVTGISANGTPTCATPAGGGNVSNSGTPTSGQFAEWNSSTTILGETMGGDCTLATATITCTKTNGTAFGTFATQSYATPPAIGGTTPAAGTFSTLAATGALTTDVTGSTQCLQANSSGVVSGTGNSCGGSGSTGANPTASVGLTAVNGTATTFLRSDGAPALSQAISPTMTGQWTFTNNGNLKISPSSTYAEDWRLIDGQSGGHIYGGISGYCNGAGPGSWTLYDYTVTASRVCLTSSGNWSFLAPSAGIGVTVNGAGASPALQINSGSNASQATADIFLTRVGSTANMVAQGPNLELQDTGATTSSLVQHSGGQTEFWQYNGSWQRPLYFGTNWGLVVGSPSGGSEGFGTINTGALYINGSPVSAVSQSSGTGTLTNTSGCTSTPAGALSYVVTGQIASVTVTGNVLCQATGSSASINYSGLPSAVIPASTHSLLVLMNIGNAIGGSINILPAACTITTGGAVNCISGTTFTGTQSGIPANSTFTYPLN